MSDECLHEEPLGDGLRYTEESATKPGGRPTRLCELHCEGVEKRVAYASLLSFDQRIGSVAVASEGFAGVAASPEHRRKGYVSTLLRRAMERAAERVPVVYLYGIQGLYQRFGFVECHTDCWSRIAVRDAEKAPTDDRLQLRAMRPDDIPSMVELYNREHGCRPWTHVRSTTCYHGPDKTEDWSAGQTGIVAEAAGRLAGYLILQAPRFGVQTPSEVFEACARTAQAADTLIADCARRMADIRHEFVSVNGPADCTVGRALRRLGCRHTQETSALAGGMGCILNRTELVQALAPELERRAGEPCQGAVERLATGDLVPHNARLLQLLTGYHSLLDARDMGMPVPTEDHDTMQRWFPGAGPSLPVAYTHLADRY